MIERWPLFLALLLAIWGEPITARADTGCGDLPQSRLKMYSLAIDRPSEHIAAPKEITDAVHPLMDVVYAIDSKVATEHRIVPAAEGGYCDAPETVVVGFGVARRDVFLAPQAAADRCVKAALLEHEAEHDRMLEQTIQSFVEKHRVGFGRELARLKGQSAATPEAARAAFEAGLLKVLAPMLEEFTSEQVVLLKPVVDSADRLAALRRSCGGRLEALEQAALHGPEL